LGYAGQCFTFGTIASLLFLLTTHGSAIGWVVLGITWLFRLVMAWVVGVNVLHDPVVKRHWWLVPLSDIVRFCLWCNGFISNTIEWRGQHLLLMQNGKLVNLSPTQSSDKATV
jgi:ceramide glucosyltransferase